MMMETWQEGAPMRQHLHCAEEGPMLHGVGQGVDRLPGEHLNKLERGRRLFHASVEAANILCMRRDGGRS